MKVTKDSDSPQLDRASQQHRPGKGSPFNVVSHGMKSGLRSLKRVLSFGRRREEREESLGKQARTLLIGMWITLVVAILVAVVSWGHRAGVNAFVALGVQQGSLRAVSVLDEAIKERQVSLDPQASIENRERQYRRTNEVIASLDEAVGPMLPIMDWADPSIATPMREFMAELDKRETIRAQLRNRSISPEKVAEYYNEIFAKAITVFDAQARGVSEPETLEKSVAAVEVFRGTDLMAREAALVTSAQGQLQGDQFQQFTEINGAYRKVLEVNHSYLEPSLQARYEQLVTSPEWKQLQAAEKAIIDHGPWKPGDPSPVALHQWRAASAAVTNQLVSIVRDQADRVSARTLSDGIYTGTIAGLIIVAVAITFPIFIRKSRQWFATVNETIEGLARLRDEQLKRAEKIPELLGRVRDGKSVNLASEFAEKPAFGSQEIDEVYSSTDMFARFAIEAAVSEARVLNAAQGLYTSLVYRVLPSVKEQSDVLYELQHWEENEDKLAQLQTADQLAVQARRALENMLVYAGQPSPHRSRVPAPLHEVIQSARQEAKGFQRVDLGYVHPVTVQAYAVGDVIHLLSELIVNAIKYSDNATRVKINAEPAANGNVVYIDDAGKMTTDRREWANRVVSTPPSFDRFVRSGSGQVLQLGLFAIARVAERKNIRVQFSNSIQGGTRAAVFLPDELLEGSEGASSDVATNSTDGDAGLTKVKAQLTAVSAPGRAHQNAATTPQAASRGISTIVGSLASEDGPNPTAGGPNPDSDGRPPLPVRKPQRDRFVRQDPGSSSDVADPMTTFGLLGAIRRDSGEEDNQHD